MKACVLYGIGEFRVKDVIRPKPLSGEVLVRIKACGICGSDIPRVYKDGAHKMPIIIGHEFSGEIVELGDGVTDNWLGKRVGVYPLIPCKKCVPCREHKYEMCKQYSYMGSRRDGGFSEYVAVPVWNLITLSENITYEQAAMLEPLAVAVHAIRQLTQIQESTIVIFGQGTIGMMILILLLSQGIKNVYVIGKHDVQKQKVIEFGLPEYNYCDIRQEDARSWLRLRTVNHDVDVAFECVGKAETYAQAVEIVGAGGKICLVGNPYTDMVLGKDLYWKILRNQLTLVGSWNSSFTGERTDDWHYAISLLEQNQIAPEKLISHRFDMENIEQGFHIMRDKTEEYIKIMMQNDNHG